ncbi:hypothetical protein V3C99_003598 [Haemonchus contortus]|uniref:DDE_Tnp_1_7 domain-containing protein n=1 Tax=Haemonchus contortus TaxID=6289 RepID=A0A7I4XZH6_HAECO
MEALENSFVQLLLDSDEEADNEDVSAAPDGLLADAVESSDDEDSEGESDAGWSSTIVQPNVVPFTEDSGIQNDDVYAFSNPMSFYKLFMTDDLVKLVIGESNRYGSAKYSTWSVLEEQEFHKFLAICFHMSIEKRSSLKEYWSTRVIYSGSLAARLMTRNRFIEILNSLHFADNDTSDKSNRLYKVQPVIDSMNKAFGDVYKPEKDICIDETMVPFRWKVMFRQYIHGKRHKYGIKLYKLCSNGGYTCRFMVYAGKLPNRTCPVAEHVVMQLMQPYLQSGRILTGDNFYSSIPLARKLLEHDVYYLGTIRKNRIGIPAEVKTKKLKKGEVIARQDEYGVTVLKWKDKRELYMISSFLDDTVNDANKPVMVDRYNKSKGFVDLSDQMTAYTPFIRKTSKWYLRLFCYLIFQTAVVNAWYIYSLVNEKISIREFKSRIIESILDGQISTQATMRHQLRTVPGPKREHRSRCVECYRKLAKEHGASYARTKASQVNTKCSKCRKYYCLNCYQLYHKKCSGSLE